MYKSTANIVIAKSMVCLIGIYLGRCPEKKQLLFRALLKIGTFSEVHFWSIKGVFFFQNANNLRYKL